MTCRRPEIVTRADTAGRWRAACLSCCDGSTPSFHKPVAEDWRKAHIAAAVPPKRPNLKEIR